MDFASPIVRFGWCLSATLIILSAPVSGYFLLQRFFLAKESTNWPSVTDHLESVEVESLGPQRFKAITLYRYTVNGQELESGRISTTDVEYDRQESAERQLVGLKPGQTVHVYYNPTAPPQAVLRPGLWCL